MISINVINDSMEGERSYVRTSSFMTMYYRLQSNIPHHINVFGGHQSIPDYDYFLPGDFKHKENVRNMFEYNFAKYDDDDILVHLECDIHLCYNFVEYLVMMEEKLGPSFDSVRTGFTTQNDALDVFVDVVRKKEPRWLFMKPQDYWFAQCWWMPIKWCKQYFEFFKVYEGPKQLVDIILHDWMIKVGREWFAIAIPNLVMHTGRISTIFKDGSLAQESNIVTGRRQTATYVEDPFGL